MGVEVSQEVYDGITTQFDNLLKKGHGKAPGIDEPACSDLWM